MLLEVRLLGGFSVRVDGREIPAAAWSHRRAVELVKVLALMPRHRATREQLIEILWPTLEPGAGHYQYETGAGARAPVTRPNVRSMIVEPPAGERRAWGAMTIRGVAWSGERLF